jgi:D-alanine-D-alanine ligase-like ATP-grasp enzyme
MKICVLQPDYSNSSVDYKNYDPPRNLKSFFLDNDIVDHIFLNKLSTYAQLKELSTLGYDIFINLCEGYLEWDVPSIDVIHSLELLNLPYTGPNPILYDPAKSLMKYVAYTAGVKTPNGIVINKHDNEYEAIKRLSFPLFIKPEKAGDSLGIDNNSLIKDENALLLKTTTLLEEYDEIIVEEYIGGREFTVLVAANKDGKTCTVYKPLEYVFPTDIHFKTYAHKTSTLYKDVNKPCNEPALELRLKKATENIFTAFAGVGYARLDFRINEQGEIFFLEINFTCSVFYEEGYEGSADYILSNEKDGKKRFLQHIITEGIERFKQKQNKFIIGGNAIDGFGIFAKEKISIGSTIFKGEGEPQRIITKRFVENNWDETEKEIFKSYAYPISNQVYILWDKNPAKWAPQNHSCNANTQYKGLDVIALKNIEKGEELTLDYRDFLDENIIAFNCACGSQYCGGVITGKEENSISLKEDNL